MNGCYRTAQSPFPGEKCINNINNINNNNNNNSNNNNCDNLYSAVGMRKSKKKDA